MRVRTIEHTKASHTYSLLKELITTLDIKIGAHLEVEALARIFRCSVTPIRESLNRLACEALVECQPNRGYFVRKVDLTEQFSIHELGDVLLAHALSQHAPSEISFFDRDVTPETYCDFLKSIARQTSNSEIIEIFSNLIDRSFGLIRIHLRNEKNRKLVSADISHFLDATDPLDAIHALTALRTRFSSELPTLVKEASLSTGNTISQLSSIVSKFERSTSSQLATIDTAVLPPPKSPSSQPFCSSTDR